MENINTQEVVKFFVNKKYNNYKILMKNINNLENLKLDINTNFLSYRMNKKIEELNEIKNEIINTNNLFIYKKVDKLDLYIILKSLSNLNEKYLLSNIKEYKYNNELYDINKIVDVLINKVANNIKNSNLDIDDLLGIFKLVDAKIEVFKNMDSNFKLKSFKNENIDKVLRSFIYGQGFENLNLLFLNKKLNLNLKKVESLEEWNNLVSQKNYNLWLKKNQDTNISFNQWLNKDNNKTPIPSMDLISLNNDFDVFIETKNYSLHKKIDFLDLKLKHDLTQSIERINNQEKLIKDNTKLFYNFNIYDQTNKEVDNYLIPIYSLKKFYKKIDNKIQQEIKNSQRNKNLENNFFKLNLNIDSAIVNIVFKLNNLNKIDTNFFNIKINKTGFDNVFKDFKINKSNIDFELSKEK